MTDQRFGRGLRAIRLRGDLRQSDVSGRAGIGQPLVSRAERGHIEAMTVRSIRRMASALDADVLVLLRWRGGELDRLIDERHAALVGAVGDRLARDGWEVATEVSYSYFGERGSVDVMAFQQPTGHLLVGEMKTELGSVEATLRKHDEKVRLGRTIAKDRFEWRVNVVSRLLVLPGDSTPRRQIARHAAIFDRAYPLRGQALSHWLRRPSGLASGLLFVSAIPGTTRRRLRVRRRARHASNELGQTSAPRTEPAQQSRARSAGPSYESCGE